jgi:hypothetical protein
MPSKNTPLFGATASVAVGTTPGRVPAIGPDGYLPASIIPPGAVVGAVTMVAGRTGAITLGITDITSLNTALSNKSDVGHDHDSRYYTQSQINTQMTAKANASHTHAISDVINLQSTLANKAGISHNHNDLYYTEAEVNTLLAGKASNPHTHVLADITDAGNAASKTVGYAVGQLPYIGSGGYLPTSIIPTEAFDNAVTSVNGLTGAVVIGIAQIATLATELANRSLTSHTHSRTGGSLTGFGTAAGANTGTAAGNVPVLDGGGKLSTAILPPIAINEVFTAANEPDMLLLTAEVGDICIRTDISNGHFILTGTNPTLIANWQNISLAHSPVTLGTANGLSISGQILSLATATTSVAGAMSATDKVKLDSVTGGASVSSVGLTVPSWLTVAGSPVTTSGTLAVTATTGQTANQVLATPDSTTGAVGLRVLVSGDLPTVPVTKGGTGLTTATLGDFVYGSGSNTRAILAGSISATKQFLTQTGNGSVSAAPAWGTIVIGDLPTITIAKGGTGQTTQTAGFDALSPNTTLGDMSYRGASNNVRLAGNITATKQFLTQTGSGSVSAAPAWGALVAGDIPSTLNATIFAGTITVGTGGSKLKDSSGQIEFRNNADNGYISAAFGDHIRLYDNGNTNAVRIKNSAGIVLLRDATDAAYVALQVGAVTGQGSTAITSGTGGLLLPSATGSFVAGVLKVPNTGSIQFSSTSTTGGTTDTSVVRSAAGVVGITDNNQITAVGLRFIRKSATVNDRQVAETTATMPVSTDASRTGSWTLTVTDFSATRTAIVADATGTAINVGIGGASDTTAALNVTGTSKATRYISGRVTASTNTVAPDVSQGNSFEYTISNDFTLNNITNGVVGQRVLIWIIGDGSLRNITFGGGYVFGEDITAPTEIATSSRMVIGLYVTSGTTARVIAVAGGYAS